MVPLPAQKSQKATEKVWPQDQQQHVTRSMLAILWSVPTLTSWSRICTRTQIPRRVKHIKV